MQSIESYYSGITINIIPFNDGNFSLRIDILLSHNIRQHFRILCTTIWFTGQLVATESVIIIIIITIIINTAVIRLTVARLVHKFEQFHSKSTKLCTETTASTLLSKSEKARLVAQSNSSAATMLIR